MSVYKKLSKVISSSFFLSSYIFTFNSFVSHPFFSFLPYQNILSTNDGSNHVWIHSFINWKLSQKFSLKPVSFSPKVFPGTSFLFLLFSSSKTQPKNSCVAEPFDTFDTCVGKSRRIWDVNQESDGSFSVTSRWNFSVSFSPFSQPLFFSFLSLSLYPLLVIFFRPLAPTLWFTFYGIFIWYPFHSIPFHSIPLPNANVTAQRDSKNIGKKFQWP